MAFMIEGVLLSLCIILFTIVWRRSGTNLHDEREPYLIKPKVPLIGHMLGLIQHGGAYYSKISSRYKLPIYTLPLLKSKFYVINSLPLLNVVQRHSKKISSHPFVKMAADRLSGLDAPALVKFDGHEGKAGISEETLDEVQHALLHKSEADTLGHEMLTHLTKHLEDLPYTVSEDQPRSLLTWIQHLITQVSTRTVYGPENPMKDEAIEEAFWTFEHNMGTLLLGFAPGILKKKAITSRQKVIDAFTVYYESKGHLQGCALARARYDPPARYGLDDAQIARLEVAFIIALLNNTVSSAYWTLIHIFSQPDLLKDLRSELEGTLDRQSSASDGVYTIDIQKLTSACPTLLAVFHEVLRYYTLRPNVRQVMEDIVIEDKYLLKQGTMVQLSTRSVHRDPQHWGDDAGELKLRRFLGDKRKLHSAAFGAFGVAPHVCPGRHFATTQILVLAARTILQCDIKPAGGSWAIPEQNTKGFSSVTPPVRDINVYITPRTGWQGVWKIVGGETHIKFPLAQG